MKQTITNPDGTTREGSRLWGVTYIGAKSNPRSFCDKGGNFNESAWQVAMEKQTSAMLEGKPDPLENVRSARFIVQIRALGRVRYVGTRHIASLAGKLYDSALFYLWGFLKRPKAHFNFLDPHASTPVEYPEVTELRKALVFELRRKGVEPAQFDYSLAKCLQEDAQARADEEQRKADEWEEKQQKHL